MESPVRDRKGRYQKKSSGNPLGRPIRRRGMVSRTPQEIREEFLEWMFEPIKVEGRRKEITRAHALDRRMFALAMNDNRLAITHLHARVERYTHEALADLVELLGQVTEGEWQIRSRGDDVTDEFVELIRKAQARLNRLLGSKD